MAKRKRRRSKRRHRTGSVITTKRLSGNGIGKMGAPGSLLGAAGPPLLGGVLTGATIIALERMSATNGSPTMQFVGKYSAVIGVGIGAMISLATKMIVGAPAAAGAFAGSFGVAGAMGARKLLNETMPMAGLGFYGRMGAIVPQVQPAGMLGGGHNTRAIVMEPAMTAGLGDPRGETVSLGNVQPSAFGTPGFNV